MFGMEITVATSYLVVAGADTSATKKSDGGAEAASNEAVTVSVGARPNMLDDQIICGYQGWYGFPGDGAPINRWLHWFRGNATTTTPVYENAQIDMYPTMNEYDADDMKQSGVLMPDGTNSQFFSSARPNVVLKHFEWMATYGIAGVFHHRFMSNMKDVKVRDTRTMVLRNVRNAAEATGRKFAVSYDIANNGNEVIERLKADWMYLVDVEGITKSSNYILQNGLPVLHIWGIGFGHINITDTSGMQNLIGWLKSPASGEYRVFVLGGVPAAWRTQGNDSRKGTGWKNIYDSLNGLQPWHVGRWKNGTEFHNFYSLHIAADAAYCKHRGILYMPTMWPGFSWHNLRRGVTPMNYIPRDGGKFLWRQAYAYVANSNITTIWCAQFDEVDEGTAIFKVAAKASDLPLPKDGWLALDADGYSLPSDWYLRLTGEAQLMLEGRIPLTRRIPIDPNNPHTAKPTTAKSSKSRPSPEPTLSRRNIFSPK